MERTYEDGRWDARRAYAELESTSRTVRGWALDRLKDPVDSDYERGYQDGLRESIREADEAASACE
jgi:hypothetical protein